MSDLWEVMAQVEYARRLERDEAIQRVRSIHAKGAICNVLNCGDDDCDITHLIDVCVSCYDIDGDEVDWPCPTIQALGPVASDEVIEVEIDTDAYSHFPGGQRG